MMELVFLLEECSAREMLKGLLPRLMPPEIHVRFITFEGKQDLESQMVRRIQGYMNPQAKFVVLRDKDSADCHLLKAGLVQKCNAAGRPETLVRIACHELESWYLADLKAVEQALNLPNLAKEQQKKKFRTPDSLSNPAQELNRLTREQYQKIGGSRAIGPHLELENDRSHSFAIFIKGVKKIIDEIKEIQR